MSNSKIIKTLFGKEIRDIFRDRKSVLMIFFVPVVLYPLIFFVAFTVVSYIEMGIGTQTYTVIIEGDDGGVLEDELIKENSSDDSGYVISVLNKNDFSDILADQDISYSTDEDAVKKALDEEIIDVYVITDADKKSYEVKYNSSVTNSGNTYDIVKKAVDEISLKKTEALISDSGLNPSEILEPVEFIESDYATTEETFGFFLGTIIPFMMIISLLVSVFTPAIDVTTGEKERGTLETLLMMPVTNTQLIVAKFFAVALIGIISTVLSILSMALLGVYMITILSESTAVSLGGMNVSTFIPAIIVAIPVLIVLSLFMSAISMAVSCMAKTYKEANTYMSPVMIVVMLVGYIGFIPNIEFNSTIAAIPVVNVCLLIKNILLFKLDIGLVFIVLISTAAYTGIILVLLGRLYRSEAVLFDEDKGSIKLFEKRSNIIPGIAPTMGDAWFVVFVDILLLIYVGGLLQVKLKLEGVFLSQLVLVALPLAMSIYTKRNLRATFSLYPPYKNPFSNESLEGSSQKSKINPLRGFCGGIIMGIGAILINEVISVIMMNVLPDMGKAVTESIGSYMDGPALWVWFVIAVTPAVCEELVFRGYLLSAMKQRFSPIVTILLVGLIFGIYHQDLIRLPSTALLGCVFAYITMRTGSIFIGMLIHLLNNSIAVLAYLFPTWMENNLSWLLDDSPSLSTVMIIAGIGIILLAAGNLIFIEKQSSKKTT